jgi:group I intron endonuclease
MIKNILNNKVYIGLTTIGFEKRFKRHLREARSHSNRALSRAIRKYGKANFEIIPILTCFNKLDLDFYEKYFIQLFESYKKINGYNLTLGGEGGKFSEERLKTHMQNRVYKHSEETKTKISKANKGQKWTPEQRMKYDAAMAKRIHPKPMLGKTHSEVTRKKFSEYRNGKPFPQKNKPIKLIHRQTGEEFIFESVNQAAETLHINRRSISNVLNGWSAKLTNYDVFALSKKET